MYTEKTKEELQQRVSIKEHQRGTPLYIEAYRKIQNLIVSGYFKKGEKMLPEMELAEIMQIGRTSLRTALALLYEDGYLKTFHGKGTYVVYEPSAIREEFPNKYIMPRKRLEGMSDTIYIIEEQQHLNSYDAFMDEILQTKGENIVFFQRTYSIDNVTPALIMQTYFPVKLYPEIDYADPAGTELWLSEFLETSVSHVTFKLGVALVNAFGAGSHINTKNDFFSLTTIVWRDKEDRPLLFSKDYYNDNIIRFRGTLTV